MNPTRNYLCDSSINHYVKKAVKTHSHNVEPASHGYLEIKKILAENNEIITKFNREFPRNYHVQKLSSYLTPKTVTEDLEKKMDKIITDKYEKLVSNIDEQKKSLHDFICVFDEKERRLNSLVDGYKNDYMEKIEKLQNQVTSMSKLKDDKNEMILEEKVEVPSVKVKDKVGGKS